MPDRPRLLGLRLFVSALVLNLLFDALGSRLPWTTPPWLLLDHLAGLFKDLLAGGGAESGALMNRRSIELGMSIGASTVNAIIAALLATAFEPYRRRVPTLGWTLFGLATLSGGLMMFTYLAPPWPIVAGSLATGLPRSFLLAWVLDRLLPPSGDGQATGQALPG